MNSMYRNILMESAFAKDSAQYFGWHQARISDWVDSIVKALESGCDWRIDSILKWNQQLGLNLMPGQGGRILEAGFGTGSFTIAASQKGLDTVGVDYTADYVKLARQLASIAGLSEEDLYTVFRQGDVRNLEFPDNCFSVVTCFGLLSYVDDVVGTVREFMRVLKPGGLLFLYSSDHRFPFENQYGIPYLPFMKKELFEIWLKVFEKPLAGLSVIPTYVSLPIFIGIARTVGFQILNSNVTLPESEISGQLRKLTGNVEMDYLTSDPAKIYLLAQKVKETGVQTEGAAFTVLCQKLLEKLYPGSF